jgi:nitrite reductase/ring-hydroxylating ferredoxin subunit
MSDRWNQWSVEEKEMAEAVFTALSLRDPLIGEQAEHDDRQADVPSRRFGFSDIYAYVNDPHLEPAPGLLEALEQEPHLRRNLESLIAHSAICPHLLGPLTEEVDAVTAPDADGPPACQVRCPWHGYRFDIRSGRSVDGRSLRLPPAPRLEIDPERNLAWIVWGD